MRYNHKAWPISVAAALNSKILGIFAPLFTVQVISKELKQEINSCLETLNAGGTILYPTDTIWGLGCDATLASSVSNICMIKKRVGSKSLIVILDSEKKLELYVENIPPITWDLLKNVDTPLTIIYPKGKNLAHNILGEDGSVAIRIVHHEFCRELVREFGKPLVSTSANPSGGGNPHSFYDINPGIIKQVDYTVSLYHDVVSLAKASRIIKLYENGEFSVIRP